MDIRETDLTFHGRKVVQADEMFFVDAEIGAQPGPDQWLSDQKLNLVYRGCVYNRIDQTGEFRKFAHPEYVPPSDEEIIRAFTEAGFEGVEIGPHIPTCRHAA